MAQMYVLSHRGFLGLAREGERDPCLPLGAWSTALLETCGVSLLGPFVFWPRYPVPGSGRHSLECEKRWPECQVQAEAGRGKNEDLRELVMEITKLKWQNAPDSSIKDATFTHQSNTTDARSALKTANIEKKLKDRSTWREAPQSAKNLHGGKEEKERESHWASGSRSSI